MDIFLAIQIRKKKKNNSLANDFICAAVASTINAAVAVELLTTWYMI